MVSELSIFEGSIPRFADKPLRSGTKATKGWDLGFSQEYLFIRVDVWNETWFCKK